MPGVVTIRTTRTSKWPNSLHSTPSAGWLIFPASLDSFVRRVAWSKGVDWADQVARPAVDVSRPIASVIVTEQAVASESKPVRALPVRAVPSLRAMHAVQSPRPRVRAFDTTPSGLQRARVVRFPG